MQLAKFNRYLAFCHLPEFNGIRRFSEGLTDQPDDEKVDYAYYYYEDEDGTFEDEDGEPLVLFSPF